MRMLVINLKGGVGKTTTAVTFAYLASLSRSTLLVDLDSQASATAWLPTTEARTSAVEDLVAGRIKTPPIYRTSWGQLHLTPATPLLAAAVKDIPATWRGREMNALIGLLKAPTAVVVMDCHPNRSILTVAALRVATHVVIPTPLEPMALDGIRELLDYLQAIRTYNPALRLAGVLPVCYTRSRLAEEAMASLARVFGQSLLPPIRRTVRVAEAFGHRQPLPLYAPNSTASLDYQAAWSIIQKHPQGWDLPATEASNA